jgi:hypothetical protein
MAGRRSFAELCKRAHATCDRHDRGPNTYIGHLGKQDSEYDDTLADFAEFSHVRKSPLDRVWAWLVSLYQYRSRA